MTGPQMGTLRDALCSAFDQDSLDQMLRLRLDKDRGQLVGPGNLRTIVFDLIRLADRQGWLPQLVRAARQDNPGNPALRKWCEDHPDLDLVASGPSPPPPPVSVSPQAPPLGSPVARIAGFFLVAVLAAGGAAVALVSQLGRDRGRVGATPLPPGHDAAPPAKGDVQQSPAPPPPNQPPRVSAEPRLVFGRGDRTQRVEVHVTDETPATRLKVEARSQDEGLIPAAGLHRDGAGPTTALTVTPAPGRWGEAVVRGTATDPAGLTGEAVIRVSVPAPEFALAALPDIRVKRGEPVAPVALKVVDESLVSGKVTFAALADGAVIRTDGVKVANGRLELTPVKGATGAATVTVVASRDDGREARATFTLTVTPSPPPVLAVTGKARVLVQDPDVFAAEAGPGREVGRDLAQDTVVEIEQVGQTRCLVSWVLRGRTVRGWVSRDVLRAEPASVGER